MATACGDPCSAVPGADFTDLPKPPQIYHECKRHSFVVYVYCVNFVSRGFNFLHQSRVIHTIALCGH